MAVFLLKNNGIMITQSAKNVNICLRKKLLESCPGAKMPFLTFGGIFARSAAFEGKIALTETLPWGILKDGSTPKLID